jgi:uncharacterized protein (DUF169 family)
MNTQELTRTAEFIHNDLRLGTMPVAVKFFDEEPVWPAKTRRPLENLKIRITFCQAMTLARQYRWTVGLDHRDLACGPAMLLFGMTRVEDPKETLAEFFTEVGWCADMKRARQEWSESGFYPLGRLKGVVFSPLAKALYRPDVVTMYGNPAQIMRLVQAWTYVTGEPVRGSFIGRGSCSEYLAAPHLQGRALAALPGQGDRAMSMTQDFELAFALPGSGLRDLVTGLKEAGRQVGARYPVAFYQKFEPEFPYPVQKWRAGLERED